MKTTSHTIRFSGIAGAIGGIILFCGDMMFYYAPNSIDLKQNMAVANDFRIQINGILALIATWLYVLGVIQIWYAFLPAKKIFRNIVTISFGYILISYGVIHGAYIAIATTAKLAYSNGIDIYNATELASTTNNMMRLLIYPVFALLSFVFIWQVWQKKTLYPRWIIIFFPLTTFIFKDFFKEVLHGKLWIIINGGYLNLILVFFFTASTIALWKKYPKESD